VLGWTFKNLAIPIIIAIVFIFLSSVLLSPKIKFGIEKQYYKDAKRSSYVIKISNPSRQTIENFTFVVKLDGKYPISKYSLQEVSIKSGITLRSKEDYVIMDYGEPVNYNFLVSGFRGATDKLPAGAAAVIHVTVDMSYDGSMGDVLPPTDKPNLPNESYYFQYMYKPAGLFSSYYIKKSGYYDFNGNKVRMETAKKYKQRVKLPSGEVAVYEFPF